jgi:hypothetical protein
MQIRPATELQQSCNRAVSRMNKYFMLIRAVSRTNKYVIGTRPVDYHIEIYVLLDGKSLKALSARKGPR